MYTQDFYITGPVGNNAFSYHERKNKKLFVPALKKIENFDEIQLLEPNTEKITFEDFDFEGNMQTCFGLKNLYELEWKGKKIFLVDNHNHVFYFWYLAREWGIISDRALLYHVDEHADMRDPQEYLMKPDSQDLQKVFEYTNFFLNVGNFIVPAMKEGLIGEVVQIRSEGALREYLHPPIQLSPKGRKSQLQGENSFSLKNSELGGGILNLDLDFFQPDLDYIDFELKKQVILDIAAHADLITICTSPFFIQQELAIEVLREIFDK